MRLCPHLAERHTKSIVPHVIAILDRSEQYSTSAQPGLSRRKGQDRAAAYLELLASFNNPKAAYCSAKLYQTYLDVLQKGDNKLQTLALSCLMTYKSSALLPYETKVRALLDEHKFRDALLELPLGGDNPVIDPRHRGELLPVVIRLLYGIMITRKGRSSGSRSSTATRKAILAALGDCSTTEIGILVGLMMSGLQSGHQVSEGNLDHERSRQQSGFLDLMSLLVQILAVQTLPFWPRLIDVVLQIIDHAQQRIVASTMETEDDWDEVRLDQTSSEAGYSSAVWRRLRTNGVKSLVQLVSSPVDFDWMPYIERFFVTAVEPRLNKLEIENSQAPSATLELIAAMVVAGADLAHLDPRLWPKTYACLHSVKVKELVVIKVLSIVEALIDQPQATGTSETSTSRVPDLDHLLNGLGNLVTSAMATKSQRILDRVVPILSRLSVDATRGPQAQGLAQLLGTLLHHRKGSINQQVKSEVLLTLRNLYDKSPDFMDPHSDFFNQQFALVSSLLQRLSLPSSRNALVTTMSSFARVDTGLADTARLLRDLNALSTKHVGQPDFDKRLSAYGELIDLPLQDSANLDERMAALDPQLPVLHSR